MRNFYLGGGGGGGGGRGGSMPPDPSSGRFLHALPVASAWLRPCHRIALSRLRTSCHQLEMEVGRHHKPPIPENERICKYCSTSSIDNETHFLIECPATNSLRQTLWNTVQSVHPHFQNLSSIERMKLILASTNKNIVCEAASYTYRAFEHRKRLTATTATK